TNSATATRNNSGGFGFSFSSGAAGTGESEANTSNTGNKRTATRMAVPPMSGVFLERGFERLHQRLFGSRRDPAPVIQVRVMLLKRLPRRHVSRRALAVAGHHHERVLTDLLRRQLILDVTLARHQHPLRDAEIQHGNCHLVPRIRALAPAESERREALVE